MAKANKPTALYTEKYRRGVYETDRKKIKGWVDNQQVQMEIREGSVMSDDTESITITFHKIPRK